MENRKSDSAYLSAFELLKERNAHYFDGMSDDVAEWYNHFDDFECVKYQLNDDETVCVLDDIDDSLLVTYDSVEMFFLEIGKMYADEKAEDFDRFYDTNTSVKLSGPVYTLTIKSNVRTECKKDFTSVSELIAFLDAVSIGIDISYSIK